MSDLIEALKIFLKYGNPNHPTHCEHDVLTVVIPPKLISAEDKQKLDVLGFSADDSEDCFKSFRYGSC